MTHILSYKPALPSMGVKAPQCIRQSLLESFFGSKMDCLFGLVALGELGVIAKNIPPGN